MRANHYLLVKRIFDIFISIMALITLSPLLLLIAATIKLTSKGNVFFKQKRITKDGRLFIMYKFRTMIENAEASGTGLFSYKGDPRVTKIGHILRKFSLDELPQFYNVLKGDMSLIGPRPPVSYGLGDYETLNARYKKRFSVLQGITGLAQVSGRNELPWDIKVDYDNKYIDLLAKKGFQTDLKIFFLTFGKIFAKKDIYENKTDENIDDEASAALAAMEVISKAHAKEDERMPEEVNSKKNVELERLIGGKIQL